MHSSTRNLRSLVRSESRRYTAAVLCEGLSTLLFFATPWLMMFALDLLAEEPAGNGFIDEWLSTLFGREASASTFWRIAAAIGICSGLGGILLGLRIWLSSAASERIVRRLRQDLLTRIQRLPMPWHDDAETGDVVQRCSSDVDTVRLFLATQIVEIGRALILLAFMIPALLHLDTRMALWSLALFPFILGFALSYFRRVRVQFLAMDEAEGRMTGILQENLTGIRVVRAFARQDFEKDKFGHASRDYREKNGRFIELLANFWAVSDLMCFGQLGLVLVVGALRIQEGTLTVGTFFAVFSYLWVVIWPVRHMGRVLAETGKATVSMGRIREVLEAETEGESPAASNPEIRRGSIEFRGVSFAYGEGPLVLDNLSFRLEAGETLGLIGPPGSGKSTIVRLLLRLYDGYEGEILLDGVELRERSIEQTRSAIAAVLQQPFLFARTVHENLTIGHAGKDLNQLQEATRAASLHDSILEFESGYDTLLGERGVTLSGGQRQRLAISRAIAKEAPILILDDSLSAVDAETEESIQSALEPESRTKILCAHRVSTLRSADRILLLDGGRVVESGNHKELMERDGNYARIVRMQNPTESLSTLDRGA